MGSQYADVENVSSPDYLVITVGVGVGVRVGVGGRVVYMLKSPLHLSEGSPRSSWTMFLYFVQRFREKHGRLQDLNSPH